MKHSRGLMKILAFHILVLAIFCLTTTMSFAQAGNTDELLAAQYFREGDFEKALALYEVLFVERPSAVIYNNYLESLFALGEFRRAERVVRSQINEHPGEIRYEVDLGWVHHRAGNSRQERRQFDGLIGGLKANYNQVVDLAAAFEFRGFFDRALETFYRGRELMGERYPLHLHIASLYDKTGNHRSMMGEYLDYMVKNRDDMDRVRGILQEAIINDPGFKRNDALRHELLSRTQNDPGNILFAEMLLWLSFQQQDFRMAFMQARALDRRLQQDGELVMEVARLSAANGAYRVASESYQYLLGRGEEGPYYMDALVGYLHVRFLSVTSEYQYTRGELLSIENEYRQAIEKLGLSAATVQLVRNLANMQAFYLDKVEDAVSLLESVLDIPNVSDRVKAECRVELADILVLTGEVWDAKLLYAQVDRMFRDDPLAHEAKFKNARLSYFIGEFDWAKAQLDILKAGTSRLIANDAIRLSLRIQDNIGPDGLTEPLEKFSLAERQIFMNRFDDALRILDQIATRFPNHQINDDVLMAKAEIMQKSGKFSAADSLLAQIVADYPDGILADEALFRRAELYHHHFDQQDKAMSLYQQLMLDYPGSLFTITSRVRFRELRGDVLN